MFPRRPWDGRSGRGRLQGRLDGGPGPVGAPPPRGGAHPQSFLNAFDCASHTRPRRTRAHKPGISPIHVDVFPPSANLSPPAAAVRLETTGNPFPAGRAAMIE